MATMILLDEMERKVKIGSKWSRVAIDADVWPEATWWLEGKDIPGYFDFNSGDYMGIFMISDPDVAVEFKLRFG